MAVPRGTGASRMRELSQRRGAWCWCGWVRGDRNAGLSCSRSPSHIDRQRKASAGAVMPALRTPNAAIDKPNTTCMACDDLKRVI